MKNYKNIFIKDKFYTEDEINLLSDKNNLIITDCLKNDNELTIGLDKEDEPRWQFELLNSYSNDYPWKFRLKWTEFELTL